MQRYDFPEEEEPINLKYKIGDIVPKMPEIENLTFVFAFDYLSLKQTQYCFDNPNITKDDFIKIYKLKKELAKISVKDIQDRLKQRFHFHSIDLNTKTFLLKPFKELLNYPHNIEVYKLPSLYQIAVYTDKSSDKSSDKAPRIVGFFGKHAVFHILWLDYEHNIYKVPEKYR